jgi:hypothetical protein
MGREGAVASSFLSGEGFKSPALHCGIV